MSPAAAALLAIALAAGSGLPGALLPPGRAAGERLAAALLWLAAGLGLWAAGAVLLGGAPSILDRAWPLPGGRFSLRLDALAAFFLVPVFGLGALGATYGLESWAEAANPATGRRLRVVYGLITAGLALVMVAGNALVFLAGWEVMALAAFLAVGTEDHLPEVREASFLYLVVTRFSTLCLFAMFALLHRASGSWQLEPLAALEPRTATAVFLLGVAGFGTKAGLMPFHVWLPGAHAAAPGHVSALMSGVLIKVGVYGLVRLLALLPPGPAWWGEALVAAGAASGVLGVAFALGQHDLKRLLAYHSIENIGIIVLGLGLATLGRTHARPELVVLGLGGCLLHVWNHGLFKGLLFLSGAAAAHACHTRELDLLGGLQRRMPKVSALFLLGAVAICGLPPLNGLVSELLLYLGLFAAASGGAGPWLLAALTAPALALIGGLALACFVKVYGVAFLGSPRSGQVEAARDPGPLMLAPMAALAAGCVGLGLLPVAVAPVLDACAAAWAPALARPLLAHAPLGTLSAASLGLAGALGAAALVYWRRLGRAPAAVGPTWDCGYAAPGPRMQYTASSFAEGLVSAFAWALRPHRERVPVQGRFPGPAALSSHVGDAVLDQVLRPLAGLALSGFGRLRWVQAGNLWLYLAFIALALVTALAWLQGVP